MDRLSKVVSNCLLPAKKLFKLILDLIENCHSYSFSLLNSQNLTKQYFSKISSFESQLNSYSPFTLILFGIFLIFIYYFIKLILNCFAKIVNFFLNIKENLILLLAKLPGQKAKFAETKKVINEGFKKNFRKKFQKIEFYDNKQDYTKILLKMEKNFLGDNPRR